MRRRFILLSAPLLAALIMAGCQQPAPAPVVATVAKKAVPPASATHAQGPLQTMKLWLGQEEMVAELAMTDEEVMTGMMFRTNMAENAGMLFIFPGTFKASFWMKNCPLPLSAAYIAPDGKILEIRKLEPFNTNSVVAASSDVQFVIEANDGWFERKHIPAGTMVRTEHGTLQETFFSAPR